MVKLRAYIRWLESNKLLGDLLPIDVPVGFVPRPLPKYLEKDELKKILVYLDKSIIGVEKGSKFEKYNAFLNRAIIRFLYTTGLRNAELRLLKMHDLNLQHCT